MADKLHVLITFALDPELVDAVRSVDPERVVIEVLGQEQRRLLRGFRYPSEREREAVAQGLHGAFEHAEVVFGFWGAELHTALLPPGGWRDGSSRSIAQVAPRLKWVQLTSAGADRLLNSGFVEEGITVTTASGLHATPIGEFVIGAMLMWAKGAPRTLRAQLRHEWVRFAPTEFFGKTVGVVGMGHIGAEVARLAKAFGCRVIGSRRSVDAPGTHEHADELLPPGELARLLGASDYVAVCVPLTPETRGLIGERELRAMRPSAFLVNIARGPVIVEADLVRALNEGWIAGAALDVFEREPLPPDSPLWDMDNVILTPHVSGGTEIYNRRAVDIFTANLRRYLAGQPLLNTVDPTRGY